MAFLGNDCPRKVAEWRDPRLMIVIIVKIARHSRARDDIYTRVVYLLLNCHLVCEHRACVTWQAWHAALAGHRRSLSKERLLFSARILASLRVIGAVVLFTMASPVYAQRASSSAAPSNAMAASRIIAIGGDITEILYAIGAETRVIAVDATSQFPPEALKEKKNIGYMRALSTEGVLSVNGDLIIASDRTGPPEVVKALKSAPVKYIEISDDFSPASVANKTRVVARAVGFDAEGDNLAARIERDFAALAELRKQIGKPARVLFVLNVVNGRVMVGGSQSSADAILRLAGAENAAAAVNGYKPISDEALVEIRPDAIVSMSRSGNHDSGQITSIKGLSASPAVKSKRIIQMDGLYLLGFGPRAPAAALDLMRRLYPQLSR